MNKTIVGIITIIVVAGGAFWGGMQYAAGQAPARQPGSGFSGQYGAGLRGGRTGGAGGFITGQIVSSDPGSIAIQTASTSSMIVLVGSSTEVLKTTAVSQSSLTPGTSIVVMGTPNSDGSMTAQSIQIRPAGLNFPGRGAAAVSQSGTSAQ